jgi:hypothetical protein
MSLGGAAPTQPGGRCSVSAAEFFQHPKPPSPRANPALLECPQARSCGALRRCRKIPDASVLLHALLLHLAEGCSLRETAVRLKEGGILDISDVAIMDRLRQSAKWFNWMNNRMLEMWIARKPAEVFGFGRKIIVADGTRIQEQGPTGSGWKLHYAIGLSDLKCEQALVKDWANSGEGFGRFEIQPGELWVGDGAYGKKPGIAHMVNAGADVIAMFAFNNLPLLHSGGASFDLLAHLRTLGEIAGRICALKKSPQATEKALKAVRRKAQKNQNESRSETLESAGYIFVFTTLKADAASVANVLEIYRGRWQVELVFKRLKSILGFGHLPKRNKQSIRSWLEGKLLVALLREALLVKGESFFPWGYPLQTIKGA